MNYKIINATLLVEDDMGVPALREADLYIRNGEIFKICDRREVFSDDGYELFDASNMLLMPGLINMHTHAYMTPMRSYADDVPFNTWLFDRIDPAEGRLRPSDAYFGAELGMIEMIESGTTTFVDMHMFRGQSALAARECGMRAFIGRGLVGDDIATDGASRFAEALSEYREYKSELVNFIISPHALYTCSPKLLSQVSHEAASLGLLKQIHLAESDFEAGYSMDKFGMSPTEKLSEIGFLDKNTILAHCVKLSDSDIRLIRDSGATVVTNPASNAKLGNGIAPIQRLLENKINVTLGTDGAASNNTLNMFREMSLLSLLHKASSVDSMLLPSRGVLGMVGRNAAAALNMQGKIGVIAEGARADIAFINLRATSLFPNNDIITSLCYSANGSEVDSLMVDGKFLMRHRELTTIDRERVYYEVSKTVKECL